MSALPEDVARAISLWLENSSRGSHRAAQEMLTHAYRSGGTSATVDLPAYLVTRAPATFAAVSRAIAMAQLDEFHPVSMLDVGAGAGSASWATLGAWPSIEGITFFDINASFLKLAQEIASFTQNPALNAASFLQGNITESRLPPASIVVSSYMLVELPENATAQLVQRLWDATAECLVLVEPGTPAGFTRIRRAREALIRAGAAIAAPCTHANTCPIVTPDWCHFKVRLSRTREHMHAKSASVPYEDEPFSFLIAHRGQQQTYGARILAPVKVTKSVASLRLCSHEGMQEMTIASREKTAFKRAKKLDWGDRYEGAEE